MPRETHDQPRGADATGTAVDRLLASIAAADVDRESLEALVENCYASGELAAAGGRPDLGLVWVTFGRLICSVIWDVETADHDSTGGPS